MYEGGVAIIVREDLQRRVTQIERVGNQILTIILTNKNAVAPVITLATYAPHMGYTVDEKNNTGI